MKRLAITLGILLLLISISYWFAKTAGFLDRVERADQSGDADLDAAQWWRDVKRPEYFNVDIDSVDDEFERRLQAAAPEIEKAQEAVDRIPEAERYRIAAGPEAPRGKDAVSDYRRYLESFVDTYRERTADSGDAKRLGEQFLTMYMDRYSGMASMPESEATAKVGEEAIDAGSEDPLLRALYCQMWSDDPESKEGVLNTLHQSAERLEEEDYPAGIVMTIRRFAWQVSRTVPPASAAEARKFLAVEAAIRFLAEEANEPRSRFTWWQLYYLLERLDDRDRRAVYAGALQNGTYNEFTMHMLAGWIYRDEAWQARGDGFANTVSEAGWKRTSPEFVGAGYGLVNSGHLVQ